MFRQNARAYEQGTHSPQLDTPFQAPQQRQAPTSDSNGQQDPRYQDPRYQDPRYQDPRYQGPRYQDPRYQDPRYQDPRYQDPRYQDPRYQDPRNPDPRTAVPPHEDPRRQDPRYQDPRHQDPRYQDPRQNQPNQGRPLVTSTYAESAPIYAPNLQQAPTGYVQQGESGYYVPVPGHPGGNPQPNVTDNLQYPTGYPYSQDQMDTNIARDPRYAPGYQDPRFAHNTTDTAVPSTGRVEAVSRPSTDSRSDLPAKHKAPSLNYLSAAYSSSPYNQYGRGGKYNLLSPPSQTNSLSVQGLLKQRPRLNSLSSLHPQ